MSERWEKRATAYNSCLLSQNKDQRAYKVQFFFLTATQDASAFLLKELSSFLNKIVFILL